MNILENEIEDVIWEAIDLSDHAELQKRGLPILRQFTYYRQVELSGYGRADLVGVYVSPSKTVNGKKHREGFMQVFELKKDEINAKTFFQAIRYAKALQHKLYNECIKIKFQFTIHLVGKSISLDGSFVYLTDIFPKLVSFYTFKISLTEGIIFFPETGYSQTNPGFCKAATLAKWIKENVDQNVREVRESISIALWEEERAKRGPVLLSDVADDLPF